MNFGDILMARLLSILTLSIFMLLIFSNVLVSFSTLYRSGEVAYLLQAPLRYDHYFHARFFECVVFSFVVTRLSRLAVDAGLRPRYRSAVYLLCRRARVFRPLILVPAALGALITMTLARVFPA